MPKKILQAHAVPTLIQERLRMWGSCIKKQRIAQNIRADDLCSRMGISDATLRRLERGDPGAGTGIFLTALLVLGVFDLAAPAMDESLWNANQRSRVSLKSEHVDGDF